MMSYFVYCHITVYALILCQDLAGQGQGMSAYISLGLGWIYRFFILCNEH